MTMPPEGNHTRRDIISMTHQEAISRLQEKVILLEKIRDHYRRLARLAVIGAGLYAISHGIAMVMGGSNRFWGPSYVSAVDFAELVQLSPALLWGVTLGIAGALVLAPRRRVTTVGLYAIASWCSFYSLAHLLSVNLHPLASTSGIFTHGYIAVAVAGLIALRRADPKV